MNHIEEQKLIPVYLYNENNVQFRVYESNVSKYIHYNAHIYTVHYDEASSRFYIKLDHRLNPNRIYFTSGVKIVGKCASLLGGGQTLTYHAGEITMFEGDVWYKIKRPEYIPYAEALLDQLNAMWFAKVGTVEINSKLSAAILEMFWDVTTDDKERENLSIEEYNEHQRNSCGANAHTLELYP